MPTDFIGKPLNRVDGLAKVLGQARYTAEFHEPGLLHGVVLSSAIAKGRITRIDASKALQIDGVVDVLTHENTPKQTRFDLKRKDMDAPPGSPFRPLCNEKILFSMQPVALVVADSLELARYAAMLVEIEYEKAPHQTRLRDHLDQSEEGEGFRAGFESPKSHGDFEKAFRESEVQLERSYFHGAEHHNPMEMHASVVLYGKEGDLTIYDKTQGVLNTQHYVAMTFGIRRKKLRVLSPFVGGAFGSALRPQYQLHLAVLAATHLKRSIKVELSRPQMFSFGHRPMTEQTLCLGASRDGALQALRHTAYSETSRFEKYIENVVNWGSKLYNVENGDEVYRVVPLDMYTPLDMRAPGGATGVHALETAMDELAVELKMDPLELRLRNYTDTDKATGKPFSSKALRACYRQAAERFGWSRRDLEPRSTREGHQLIGTGMASGIWDALQFPARAKAVLTADLKLEVSSATADIGTGTYTIMTQIAAEELGLPMENVTAKLGDSDLTFSLIEGGSATAASIGTAIQQVCRKVKKKLLREAGKLEHSPFHGADLDDVLFQDGEIRQINDPTISVSIATILAERKLDRISKKATAFPNMLKQRKYALNTHSAVFAEVAVDEDLGSVTVRRIVSAVAAGRILNLKTAHSQILGGIVWGISMALHEDSVMDHELGRFMNHDLAEYHVAVNADIGDIDIIFVEEEDPIASQIGVKGVGEIGLIGVAAAIGNAVYHATGKRIRELPITLDKLLAAD